MGGTAKCTHRNPQRPPWHSEFSSAGHAPTEKDSSCLWWWSEWCPNWKEFQLEGGYSTLLYNTDFTFLLGHTHLRIQILQSVIEISDEEHVMELVGDIEETSRTFGLQIQAFDYVTEVGIPPKMQDIHELSMNSNEQLIICPLPVISFMARCQVGIDETEWCSIEVEWYTYSSFVSCTNQTAQILQ